MIVVGCCRPFPGAGRRAAWAGRAGPGAGPTSLRDTGRRGPAVPAGRPSPRLAHELWSGLIARAGAGLLGHGAPTRKGRFWRAFPWSGSIGLAPAGRKGRSGGLRLQQDWTRTACATIRWPSRNCGSSLISGWFGNQCCGIRREPTAFLPIISLADYPDSRHSRRIQSKSGPTTALPERWGTSTQPLDQSQFQLRYESGRGER